MQLASCKGLGSKNTTMKPFKKTFILILLTFLCKFGFCFGIPVKFVSIDSVNNKHLTCLFDTKFKTDSVVLFLQGKRYLFYQTPYYTLRKHYQPRCLSAKLSGDTVICAYVSEIKKITLDSIFTTLKVSYYKQDRLLKKAQKVDDFGIAKNTLIGLLVSAPKKERNGYTLQILTLGLVVLALSIIL